MTRRQGAYDRKGASRRREGIEIGTPPKALPLCDQSTPQASTLLDLLPDTWEAE